MEKERKNKKTLRNILLFITLITVITIYFLDNIQLYYLGEYEFVIKGDKDNVYERLLLVKKSKSNKIFHKLLDTLLNPKHPDMITMGAAVRYVKENHLTEYKQSLKSILTHFDSIPKDSVWEFKVHKRLYRINRIKNAAIIPDILETINELELYSQKHK